MAVPVVDFSIELSEKSIQDVIDDIDDMIEYITENAERYAVGLAKNCEINANMLLRHTRYGEDVLGNYTPATDVATIVNFGNEICMVGEQVAFIEFGAGASINETSEDPIPRSNVPGMVPWGMFGLGHGADPSWSIMYIYGGGQPSSAAEHMQKDSRFAPLNRGTKALYPLSTSLIAAQEHIESLVKSGDMWDCLINGSDMYFLYNYH